MHTHHLDIFCFDFVQDNMSDDALTAHWCFQNPDSTKFNAQVFWPSRSRKDCRQNLLEWAPITVRCLSMHIWMVEILTWPSSLQSHTISIQCVRAQSRPGANWSCSEHPVHPEGAPSSFKSPATRCWWCVRHELVVVIAWLNSRRQHFPFNLIQRWVAMVANCDRFIYS